MTSAAACAASSAACSSFEAMIVLCLPFLIRTVTAAAAGAGAAAQVIGRGKYHAAALQIKIPLLQSRRLAGLRDRRRPRLWWLSSRSLHLSSDSIRADSHGPVRP